MSGAGDRPRRQGDTRSLFVRIPHAQADKLDRAAFELGAHKQDLIAGLVDRYVDPSSPTALSRLGGLGFGSGGTRRVTVETDDSSLTVGRASFLPAEPREVLTLAELAELLQLDEEK